MYFETIDLCKKLFSLNHKMFVIENLKFDHIGTGSAQKNIIKKFKLIEIGIIHGRNFIFLGNTITIYMH